MNAYTISRLAGDAGVSNYIIRDYELRGLIQPCACAANGYRIYDHKVLQRLQFVLAGKAAGVSLKLLTELCRAVDRTDRSAIEESLLHIHESLDQQLQAIQVFRRNLSQRFDSQDNKKATAQS